MGIAIWSLDKQRFIHTEVVKTVPTPKKERGYACYENTRRCRELAKGLRRLFLDYQVMAVVAEIPHGGAQNQKAAVGMAIATATAYLVFYLRGIPFYVVRPSEIKCVVNGTDKASKEEVILFARKLYGRSLIPNDSSAEHIADSMLCLEVAKLRLPEKVWKCP